MVYYISATSGKAVDCPVMQNGGGNQRSSGSGLFTFDDNETI